MSNHDLQFALRALERDGGRILPEDVVEAARDPRSPMHSHFTWDDSEAARKQRLHEARALIRQVKIEVVVRDVPLAVHAYVRDPESEANQAGYRNILNVRSEADQARAVIVDEMIRVSNAVNRAKRVAAMLGTADDLAKIEALANAIVQKTVSEDTTKEVQ